MKTKHCLILIILSGLIGFALGNLCSYTSKEETPLELQKELQELGNRLDTLKVENVTLVKQNDSIQVRIVKIKEDHEKTANTILSNDVESDYNFFTDYINSFRLLHPDYCAANEDCEFDL